MTLEEFAKDAGCVVFEMHPDDAAWHGGRYGYYEKGRPHVRNYGYRTPASACKDFMSQVYGEQATKAIIKLLKKTEKCE